MNNQATTIPIVFTALFLAGCQTVEWSGKCGTISRTSLGSDLNAGRTTISIGSDCSHKITIDGVSDKQTEALKAAVEGAVKGAVEGVGP